MITATAVLHEFPSELQRLTTPNRDKDAIGIRQFIAYALLIGSATRAFEKMDLWRELPPADKNKAREAVVAFRASSDEWRKLSFRDHWAQIFRKPRETVAVNWLFGAMQKLADVMYLQIQEDDRRASVIAHLYNAAPASEFDDAEPFVTFSSEQIRTRAC
jgi:hypothetical protein